MSIMRNWARNQACAPARVEAPSSEAEVAEIVRDARRRGLRVKVVGGLHSWSDVAMTDGVALSLDRMQDVLALDEAAGTVRVQAGIRLHRLNAALAERGWGLTILGSVAQQSLAGVIATGTHGSSLVHGNLSSFVVALRLVMGTGESLELGPGDPRLEAARVGLGLLGVVTEVTLRVERAFRLRERRTTLPLDEAIADLPAIARSAEYVKVWWLPFTEHAVVFRYERTEAAPTVSGFGRWLDEHVVNRVVFAALLWVAARVPGWVPAINRLVGRTYLADAEAVGPADRVLTLAMPPRHRETECAVPLESAPAAAAAVRRLAEAHRCDFIVEARFVRGDGGWVSPASGGDVCQIGGYMGRDAACDGYFSAIADALRPLGARPHWGKEWGGDAAEVRARFPRADDFVALMTELDPDGVFRNAFADRLLPR